MNRALFLKMIKEKTDTENFYTTMKNLGEKAVRDNIKRNQISNLENIANSTFKVSDIIDYIKRQTARHREWQKGVGDNLLNFINRDVTTASKMIKSKLNEDIPQRKIQLQLLRELIHSFAVNFEYYGMKRKQMK